MGSADYMGSEVDAGTRERNLIKKNTFKEGDPVYLPQLGDKPGSGYRLFMLYFDRQMQCDMAMIESAEDRYRSSFPLEYVELDPGTPENSGLLIIFVIVIALIICGFLYHSM